jgi:hypothetical protein
MSQVISLGYGCQVIHNINKCFGKSESNFFDWLITDFKSVIYILKNINNKGLLSVDKFKKDEKKGRYNYRVENIDFKMISIHDIRETDEYMEKIHEFIIKYNRRIDRLKKFIESDEKIHFVHCIDHQYLNRYIMTNEDIYNFKKYLNDINPNNKCILHIAIPPKYNNIDLNYLIQDNVYVYYLIDTKEGEISWTNENFNWNIIFDNIKKINQIV